MTTPQLSRDVASRHRLKRVAVPALLAVLLALSIATYFWIDSRYPALLKKLHFGKAIHVSAGLSFDALLPVTPQMPLTTRVAYTAIDWAWTNRIGMTFGVFFGAAVMTVLGSLSRRRFTSAYANTALGAAIGTPLGVCANCVAPIGRGLVRGGASPATMLGAMIASPTLNLVVLAMAFTLLPLKIALIRLAAPLVLLALVPLLLRSSSSAHEEFGAECALGFAPKRTWAESLQFVLRTYFVNLGRLALATVPWMLVAGLLGALVIELIPPTSIPAQVSLLGLVLVAFLGTFAPVPIAFDVALAWILFNKGVPAPYVAALACTLGAFSIYPAIIVGQSLSWRVAAKIFAAVVSVGILAGTVTALLV